MSDRDTAEVCHDWSGIEAPVEYQGRDLKQDVCPCGCRVMEEFPAGYFHCGDCGTTWAGDPTDAELVDYFPAKEEAA